MGALWLRSKFVRPQFAGAGGPAVWQRGRAGVQLAAVVLCGGRCVHGGRQSSRNLYHQRLGRGDIRVAALSGKSDRKAENTRSGIYFVCISFGKPQCVLSHTHNLPASQASVLFTEDANQTAKVVLSGAYKQLPYLTTVVQWSGVVAATAKSPRGQACPVPPPPRVLSWPQFQGMATAGATAVCGAAAMAERAACVKPGHCAALVYTSGTTGNPKAVRA